MIDNNLLFLFSGVVFILMITPGTDMVFVFSNSISNGRKAGVASVMGVASGAYIHVLLASIGVGAAIAASPNIYNLIVIVGAIYVGWIGWGILQNQEKLNGFSCSSKKSLLRIYKQGLITNLLNPKAIVFTLSFFPQFVSAEAGNVSQQMLILGIVLVIIMISVELPLVFFAGSIRDLLSENESESEKLSRYIYRIAGGGLILLAIYISISRLII